MKKIFIIWLAFLSLIISSTTSAAQDVRLLIDLSGSMKQNDPRSLRSESLRLFVDQLQNGDMAGVWTFANQVNMLVPFGPVDGDWKSLARDRITDVHSLGQWTNIGKALEVAAQNMAEGTEFILISDGKVDISQDDQKNQVERQRIIDQLIPQIKSQGGSIHTIALADSYDVGVLARLAKETQGSFYQAKTLNGLEEHLLNIIQKINDHGEVPIRSNKFFVDKTTRSFKATLFKGNPSTPIVLKSPDGQVYQSQVDYTWVDWMSAENYDEIVVTQPRGGIWEIVGNITSESQVTLDSDLGVQFLLNDQIVFPGESVLMEMTVTSYGQPVLEPAYLNLLEVTSEVLGDNQKPFAVPTIRVDGRYIIELDPSWTKPGTYQLETQFSGPDFIRQVTGTIRVLDHLTLDVLKQADSYRLRVMPVNPELSKGNTRLQAVLEYPDTLTKILDFKWQKGGYWETLVTSNDSGAHKLNVEAKIEVNGKTIPITFVTQTLNFPKAIGIEKDSVLKDVLSADNSASDMQIPEQSDMQMPEQSDMKMPEQSDSSSMDTEVDLIASEGLQDAIEVLLDNNLTLNSLESNADMMSEMPGMDDSNLSDQIVEPRAFIKYPIEQVEVLNPALIVVVPDADDQLGSEDPWLEEIPEEVIMETGPSLFDLFLWSLPALAIISGFYLFFFKFMKHQRNLSHERNELEDMIRVEEEKAEEALKEEVDEDEDPTENFVPYDEEAIENANNIEAEDLGKDTEHLFDEDIVSMPDMESQDVGDSTAPLINDEFIDDDDDDVFDLGDLSDLGDDIDESEEVKENIK